MKTCSIFILNLIIALNSVVGWAFGSISALPSQTMGWRLALLAKGAIFSEVSSFNEQLSQTNESVDRQTKYKTSSLEFFREKAGITKLDARYLFNRCALSSENLDAIFAGELNDELEAAAYRLHALDQLKSIYPRAMIRTLIQICRNSEKHFLDHLGHLTLENRPYVLDPSIVSALDKLIFSPTHFVRPSFSKEFMEVLGVLASTGLIIGATSDLGAFSLARLLIDPTVATNNGLGLGRILFPDRKPIVSYHSSLDLNLNYLDLDTVESVIDACEKVPASCAIRW